MGKSDRSEEEYESEYDSEEDTKPKGPSQADIVRK